MSKAKNNAPQSEPVAPPPAPPRTTTLPVGFKLPDGLVLQRPTRVEYDEGTRIVTGPADVRPPLLIGCSIV